MNGILTEYRAQGFVLTVRQLYYQLVARDVIPNNERSYQRIIQNVTDARMSGLMDWDMIEDRTRAFERRSRWDSPKDIVEACSRQFHMDMWENQDVRVFIVVEKEALVSVFGGIAHEYDVPLLAARGYASMSVLRSFAEDDVKRAIEIDDKRVVMLHFGDHDPSGLDMSRDLEDRLNTFGCDPAMWVIKRLALNMDQVKKHKPPPNPAKMTDSRFKEYRKRFGDKSWELDALKPAVLVELARKNITAEIDDTAWQERAEEIVEAKAKIAEAAEGMA
jgi:hypothetical protein